MKFKMELNKLTSNRYSIFLLIIAILAIFPLFNRSTYILHVLILGMIFAILASSWDLISSYTGQISFGHAGLFAAGAYTAAILSYYYSIDPFIGVLFAGLITGLIGLGIGFPCLRLRGFFLALTTLGFSEAIRAVILNWMEVTKGPLGLWGYPTFSIIPFPITYFSKMYYYYIIFFVLIVSIIILLWVGEGSFLGLTLKSIREDEILTMAVGINVTNRKLFAFFLSSFFAGLAGSLYAYYILTLDPIIATPLYTVLAVGMAIVGGTKTIVGPVIGAIVLQLLMEALRVFGIIYNLIAVGILIIVVILFFPDGIMGYMLKKS